MPFTQFLFSFSVSRHQLVSFVMALGLCFDKADELNAYHWIWVKPN